MGFPEETRARESVSYASEIASAKALAASGSLESARRNVANGDAGLDGRTRKAELGGRRHAKYIMHTGPAVTPLAVETDGRLGPGATECIT